MLIRTEFWGHSSTQLTDLGSPHGSQGGLAYAYVSRLRDGQRLDALDVGANDLRGVPQVDRALRVEPELG